MNCVEMSNEFDLIYNNIMSNQAPGIDEYEKSVFLTRAQNEIILDYFSPKGNKFQEGFDGSERRQIDFSNIIFVKTLAESSSAFTSGYEKLDDRSLLFELPNEALLVINESLKLVKHNQTTPTNIDKTKVLSIVPISYVEYTRVMMKPYKLPPKSIAWRLLNSGITTSVTTSDAFSEILCNKEDFDTFTCNIRYVKRPRPIVLINLADEFSDVSIDGVTAQTECELDEILHRDIVQRAAELAKAAYVGDINTQIQVGNVSATNIGVVPSHDNRRER